MLKLIEPSAPPPATAFGNFPVFRDPALLAQVERFVALKSAVAEAEKETKRLREAIIVAMEGAPKAIAGTRVIQLTEVAGSPDRIITADMVGQVIKGRAGSVQLRVS